METVYEKYDREFTSATCHVCRDLWDEIERLQSELDQREVVGLNDLDRIIVKADEGNTPTSAVEAAEKRGYVKGMKVARSVIKSQNR